MHYHTERILAQIRNNYNQDFAILTEPADQRFEKNSPYREPVNIDDLEELKDRDRYILFLEELFECGAELILETHEGHEDDGGTCYCAYIVRDAFENHFREYWNSHQQSKTGICTLSYIAAFPKHIITVWAGPY